MKTPAVISFFSYSNNGKARQLLISVALLLLCIVTVNKNAGAQGITLHYIGGAQIYTTGTAITALVPVSSGVAAPAYSSTTKVVGKGFLNAEGITLDAAGNVYVAVHNAPTLTKIAPDGTQTPVGTGLADARSVAIDAAGNLYIADNGQNEIKKIPSGSNNSVIIGGFVFHGPTGVALDAQNNVYVADNSDNRVKKILASDLSADAFEIGGANFNSPFNLSIDTYGNVFVSDANNRQVKEIFPDNSVINIGQGNGVEYNSPAGIVVDNLGNLFMTDFGNDLVKELPVNDRNNPIIIGSGFSAPLGLAMDASGTLFVIDGNHHAVKKVRPSGGYYISPALPAGLSFDNSTGTISGTPTSVSPRTDYTVTGYSGNKWKTSTVTITVNAAGVNDDALNSVSVNTGSLVIFYPRGQNYSTSVDPDVNSITVIPTAHSANATITVQGNTVASGSASATIPLTGDRTNIDIAVLAQDGTTSRTYTLTVNKISEANPNLASLKFSTGTLLEPAAETTTINYTTSVDPGTNTITVIPRATNSNATIKVNGSQVINGAESGPIQLDNDPTVITIDVTSKNGKFTNHYTVSVSKNGSTNTMLTSLRVNPNSGQPITLVSKSDTENDYTTTVPQGTPNVRVTPVASNPVSTIFVNGTVVQSDTKSNPIPLTTDTTVITTVVLAHNGINSKNYVIKVIRATPPPDPGFAKLPDSKATETAGQAESLTVNKAVSPNGNGQNDFLKIDGIEAYPDNKLIILSSSGAKIFESTGYNNKTKMFEGHSNINGAKKPAGTYYFVLQYHVNGKLKTKSGYFVLSY